MSLTNLLSFVNCFRITDMAVKHTLPEVLGSYTPEARKLPKAPHRGAGHYRTNGKSKLSEQQVKEIRWLKEYGGWSIKRLAEHYSLSMDGVRSICGYITWKYTKVQYRDFPEDFNPCSEVSSSS